MILFSSERQRPEPEYYTVIRTMFHSKLSHVFHPSRRTVHVSLLPVHSSRLLFQDRKGFSLKRSHEIKVESGIRRVVICFGKISDCSFEKLSIDTVLNRLKSSSLCGFLNELVLFGVSICENSLYTCDQKTVPQVLFSLSISPYWSSK